MTPIDREEGGERELPRGKERRGEIWIESQVRNFYPNGVAIIFLSTGDEEKDAGKTLDQRREEELIVNKKKPGGPRQTRSECAPLKEKSGESFPLRGVASSS